MSRGADPCLDGERREEAREGLAAELAGIGAAVEDEEAADPADVGLLTFCRGLR